MVATIFFVFLVLIGYLAGSICSAIIISRLFNLPDPQVEGSANPGATNVLRLAGKKYAAFVLVADMLKGLLPVLLAQAFDANAFTLSSVCLAAVLGHMYPIFFGYKGGKGVATALGAILGLHFMLGIVALAIWLMVANFTRYASLASIVTVLFVPFLAIISFKGADAFLPLLIMAGFIIHKHRANINRLIEKEEPKIKFRRRQLSDITESMLNSETTPPAKASPTNHTSNPDVPDQTVIPEPVIPIHEEPAVKTPDAHEPSESAKKP